MNTIYFPIICLQLLAEGTAGDTGDGGATGVTEAAAVPHKGAKNPLADVQYGIQDEEEQVAAAPEKASPAPDRNAAFEALIRGEYKDLYDARVQDTVQKRLKASKETVAKYEALTPTMELLAKKYGVKSDDIEALNKAIEDDDSYYEEEAAEKGISVEQLKEIRKMEKENSSLRKQMAEQSRKDNAARQYAQWMEQANQVTQIYPQFNLDAELRNDRFLDLILNNVDIKTAFEVVHHNEILPAAMQFASQRAAENLSRDIIARGVNRPKENGSGAQASATVKSDVSQLTKADRQEIARRVARGERIRF